MKTRCVASWVTPAPRSAHHGLHHLGSQQPSPAACCSAVASIWRLRSHRIKRVAQGRTSLPYTTPLLLGGSEQGFIAGHRLDDEYRLKACCLGGLAGWCRLASSKNGGSDCRVWSVLCESCQRLVAAVKHPSQQWHTPAFVGLLHSQTANPSVKGTSRKRAAPYVER